MKNILDEIADAMVDVEDEITFGFVLRYAAAGVVIAAIIIGIIKLLR